MFFLDTSVFIESKKHFYAPDICLAFWQWLSEEGTANPHIRSISNVLDELKVGTDDLPKWAQEKLPEDFFIATNKEEEIVEKRRWMQDVLEKDKKWDGARFRNFVVKADLWLIATAKVKGGCIVTNEYVNPGQSRIKIQLVAEQFGVNCCTIYDVMRELGVRFPSYDKAGEGKKIVFENGRVVRNALPSFF